MRHLIVVVLTSLTLVAGLSVAEPPAGMKALVDFDRQVAPLLAQHCLDCHGGPKPKGGLDLTRRRTALAGGKSGAVLFPGRPEESLLWQHVDSGRMPPKESLAAEEKEILRSWVLAGVPWGTDPIDPFRVTTARRAGYDWWALQPVRRPRPPSVRDTGWVRTPVDAFVLHRLEALHLHPATEADRRILIRRLSFDLLGLPPSPEDVAAFIADGSPDAYERLVERYLASPQYGVRWARHWLDVARFGESNGFEFDEFRPNAWPYRDWVVDALNRDLAYDEFAGLQLAGDILRPDAPNAVKATGFLVAGAYDTPGQKQQSEAMRRVVRQDELEDLVGTVSQTFLGLTVNCARCHDHKFDPVRQADYYRLAAALDGVHQGERPIPLPPREAAAARQRLAKLNVELAALERPGRTSLVAEKWDVSPEVIASHLNVGQRVRREQLLTRVHEQQLLADPAERTVHAVMPSQPGVTRLLLRGNPQQPAEVISAGGVASLAVPSADFALSPDAPEGDRRRRLAAWITHPRNPLFPRVLVNRLWHYHFGAGLVETPNDFGFNGGRPSHPELLDWLAAELVEGGWSIKHMHRVIVLSATYRQGGTWNEQATRMDAGDRLLWRKAPVRLEAEAVRDSLLSVSGRLDLRLGGPGFQDFVVRQALGTPANLYIPTDSTGDECNRRTLYRSWARGGRNRLLDVLDCPDPAAAAPSRAVTTTPLQALALLNNPLVLRLAEEFAERLRQEAGPDVDRQVVLAYLLAYARKPDDAELGRAREAVSRHGLAVLTRAIFNSNEFLHVD